MPREFFGGQRQGLPFVRAHVRAHKEAGGPGGRSVGAERFAVPSHKRVIHSHRQIEFRGRKDVAANGARRRTADRNDLAFQDRVGIRFVGNSKGAVLLKLFDDRARDQHLDSRHERAIAENWHRDGMNLAQMSRCGRAQMITSAPAEKDREQEEKFFHCGGVGVAAGVLSGVAEGVGVASSVEEGGGAVVVSGKSEAGGGKERSTSGAGRGASGAFFAGPLLSDVGFFFRFAAAAVTPGACSLASPTLARSSAILFLARAPSAESGCWRITSL